MDDYQATQFVGGGGCAGDQTHGAGSTPVTADNKE